MNENEGTDDLAIAEAQDAGDDRRALLKKLGRFGAYTAPVTMMLLSEQVAAGS